MLGGTLFNVMTTIVSFIVLYILFIRFIAPILPEEAQVWGFIVIFISAVVLSFIIYRYLLKFLTKKFDIEKYFDPILTRNNIRKK